MKCVFAGQNKKERHLFKANVITEWKGNCRCILDVPFQVPFRFFHSGFMHLGLLLWHHAILFQIIFQVMSRKMYHCCHSIEPYLVSVIPKRPTPGTYCQCNLSCVLRKCALRSLPLSYPKKDWRAWPRQSFFGYDTDYKIVLCCLHRLYSVVGVIPKEGYWGRGQRQRS